jgi:hypothetical protein
MDIEEGFSPIERAATMSIACENRAAFRAAKRSSGDDYFLVQPNTSVLLVTLLLVQCCIQLFNKTRRGCDIKYLQNIMPGTLFVYRCATHQLGMSNELFYGQNTAVFMYLKI